MKSKVISIVIGIVILALIVLLVVEKIKSNNLSDDVQLRNVELSTLKDSVLSVVTKNGQLISKIESVEVDKGNLKDALSIAGFDMKELRRDNIKKNNIILAMKAQLEATGSISTTVHDTFKVVDTDTIYYSIVNDWTDSKLSIFGGTIENNNLNFERYNFKVGFDFFLIEERNKSIVTVKFPDENVRLTTANSITVVHKTKWYKKWWVHDLIGLTAGILITK